MKALIAFYGNSRIVREGLLITLILLGIYLITEPTIVVNGGRGWDGVYYVNLAQGTPPSQIDVPFRYRVLLPMIVRGLSPTNELESVLTTFRCVNLTAGVLLSFTTYLLFGALFPGAPPACRLIGLLLLNCSPHSVLRSSAHYGTTSDPISMLLLNLLIMILVALTHRRAARIGIGFLAVACFAVFFFGVMSRENFLMYFVMIPCAMFRQYGGAFSLVPEWHRRIGVCVAGVGGLLGIWAGLEIVTHLSGSFPSSGKIETFEHYASTNTLLVVSTALVNVFAMPLLFLIAAQPGRVSKEENELEGVALALRCILAITIGVGVGGGSDLERFFSWAIVPCLLLTVPAVEQVVRRRNFAIWLLLFACFVIQYRVPWPLPVDARPYNERDFPDPFFLTILGDFPLLFKYAVYQTVAVRFLTVKTFLVAASFVYMVAGFRTRPLPAVIVSQERT